MNHSNLLKDVIKWGKEYLKNNADETYNLDAEVLIMYVLNFDKVKLFTSNDYILKDFQINEYQNLIEKRAKGMPVKYITGKCEFMSLDFNVNINTLIPRPDTEILVESVIEKIKDKNYNEKIKIIDIGTGSGAISVSIAYYCKNTLITAVDISRKALDIAIENAKINNVYEKIEFIESDLFKNVKYNNYDIIVSNPPYIKTDEIKTLMPSVKDYEPVSALDGGKDGLYFYRKICKNAKNYLKHGGMIFFEIGYDEAKDVYKIMKENGFYNIEVKKDLSNLDRVVYGHYN